MDTGTIELLAADAVKTQVIRTCPFTKGDDNVPSRDGFVYLYISNEKEKAT